MPQPRTISNAIGKMKRSSIESNKADASALFTFWGQFVDHDLALTPEQEGDDA